MKKNDTMDYLEERKRKYPLVTTMLSDKDILNRTERELKCLEWLPIGIIILVAGITIALTILG